MATFKILGGQFSESAKFNHAKARNKLDNGGKVTEFSFLFGILDFQIIANHGWGNITTDTVPTLLQNIEEITEINEDNAVNFTGAAGWAIVGGLLTGGIGALAGMLLGGRGKKVTFAIRLKDGSQFLCSGKSKAYTKLLVATKQF